MFKKLRRFFQKPTSSNDRDVERIRAQLARCTPNDQTEILISVPRDSIVLVPVPSETYKNSRSDVRRWSGDGFSRDVSWVQVNHVKRPIAITELEVGSSGSGSAGEVRVLRADTHDSGYGSVESEEDAVMKCIVAEQDRLRSAAGEDDGLREEYDLGESSYPPFQDEAPWPRGPDRCDDALHSEPEDPDGYFDKIIKSWIDDMAQDSPGLEFPPVRKKRESSFLDWNDILDQGIDDENPSRIAACRMFGAEAQPSSDRQRLG
ncbi:hypothetical protein LQW54_010353 [Pestalotiopsis sp. IQ-011]